MLTEFLSLLCLGLSLGFEDEKKNETLPKPSLSALSSLVVGYRGNVTLRCQSHFQNVTFVLGKLQDSRYRQEQRSTGHKAEFLLTHLEPKDAGMYFCAYKTMVSQEWSGESEYLQLKVRANRLIFAATFSCLSISVLFLAVFFINRCTQHGSSHGDSTKRTSHSEFPKQEATDLSNLERISVSTERPPQGGSHADLYLRQSLSSAEEPQDLVNVQCDR
ncbi:V-set and transmembrane domain-containing protein 1-like isoform X2 [Lontra canadensis]|uniref:V-set and transmembrane domain-containing protein 1-like isoform X2 n=1 Tax=Lontra canadensis TaxID=76717 RepID=UPI0013F30A30|nr:V-set and transmembrane domain-containing protein 1-like isoform X2 [Lontra canadensis]